MEARTARGRTRVLEIVAKKPVCVGIGAVEALAWWNSERFLGPLKALKHGQKGVGEMKRELASGWC